MKSSVIRQRVADFFRLHPPFDQLTEEDLMELAGSGRVKFHEAGETLFDQGQKPGEFLWLIQQGRVELVDGADEEKQTLRDIVSAGDLLGLDRFSGDGTFRYTARTASDVIVYSCSAALFEALSLRYPAVRHFLAASASVSSVEGYEKSSWLDAEAPPAAFLRARLPRMAAAAADGMTPMPSLAPDELTTREAVRRMLESGSRQVAIGSNGSVEAILTEADLSLFCGHQPVLLIDAIRAAASVDELTPLIGVASRMVMAATAQPRDVDDGCRLGTAATMAAMDACIRMARADVAARGIKAVDVPHCWILFGASARAETVRLEAPAVAVVCDDSASRLCQEAAIYFTALAGQAASYLHDCGLPGGASCWPDGSQPAMPLSEWKRFFEDTIADPISHDLYERREFFDLSPLGGDRRILEALEEHIAAQLRVHPETVALLANDTLVHLPPVTLFRGLVVDLEAGHSNTLNLQETVLAPVADSARVFALASQRLANANTLERLAAAEREAPPARAAAIREAADAFRAGLYYQAVAGSHLVDPGRLRKFDQVMLKAAFGSIQRFVDYTVSNFFPAVA